MNKTDSKQPLMLSASGTTLFTSSAKKPPVKPSMNPIGPVKNIPNNGPLGRIWAEKNGTYNSNQKPESAPIDPAFMTRAECSL